MKACFLYSSRAAEKVHLRFLLLWIQKLPFQVPGKFQSHSSKLKHKHLGLGKARGLDQSPSPRFSLA